MRHFSPEDIILEEAGDRELMEPPYNATNILLPNGYAVHLRSGYDDEDEIFFEITTLIPDEDLILRAQRVEGLDVSALYINGDNPSYTEGTPKIENLSIDDVAIILNEISSLEPLPSQNYPNFLIVKNSYVVAPQEERLSRFPIRQFNGIQYDPNTGNQIPSRSEQPAVFEDGPQG